MGGISVIPSLASVQIDLETCVTLLSGAFAVFIHLDQTLSATC